MLLVEKHRMRSCKSRRPLTASPDHRLNGPSLLHNKARAFLHMRPGHTSPTPLLILNLLYKALLPVLSRRPCNSTSSSLLPVVLAPNR